MYNFFLLFKKIILIILIRVNWSNEWNDYKIKYTILIIDIIK